ncbi:MAG: NifU family protein [Bacteroidetes bacterium]|nr:NifU family protein [Bacteroidota bacterium]
MVFSDKTHLLARIEEALDSIRPHLLVDGGNVELVDVTKEMIVLVRWMGMCESCNMSTMTLRGGLMHTIQSKIPEIMGVEAVNGAELPNLELTN